MPMLHSVNSIINNNNQLDQYRAFIEKLVQLGLNDWLKFQEQPKKLHSVHVSNRKTI